MKLPISLRPWLAAIVVGALAACGGGGRDPILGFPGTPGTPPAPRPPSRRPRLRR